MNSSKRITPVEMVLFALISIIGMSSGSTSSSLCQYETWSSYCRLKSVSIHTEAEATNFVFPKEKSIFLKAPRILSSAKILFGRLPDVVEEMYIYEGNVPEVYINHAIYDFTAYSNRLLKVIIDPTGTYKIRKLLIWSNLLQSVPDNIEKLTNLVALDFYYTKIETVSMDHFKDLTSLKRLDLKGNLIVRVDTTVPLNLPNLEFLILSNNKLQHLSITYWNFPKLKEFFLSGNMLRSVKHFPGKFSNLVSTSIAYNQWSCAWLEAVKSEMSKIRKDTESCSGKSVDNTCCQDYSIDDNSFNSSEEPMAFWLLQMSEHVYIIQKSIQQFDEKILKLASDTRMLIDTKVSDMDRTVQIITDEVKSLESNVRKEVFQELQKINAKVDENRALVVDGIKKFQKEIEQISVSVSKQTTEIQEKVKTMESSSRKELTQINVKVAENRASIVDDRKQLEEKISNADNQNKEEIKWVKQKLNENRALIDDVVEDLYLEELEKEEL